jgi:NAD(P)-dependent dehydrogenase (short-subunit alcohol dehydrogenase family)
MAENGIKRRRTAIVTGASKGIGAGITNAFLQRAYNVVANSLTIADSQFQPSERLALVQGDIGEASTAQKIADTAINGFNSIDVAINNAGIFFTKPFIDYTAEDFQLLSKTNLQGYIYITQLAVKHMLAQKDGGSVTYITSTMVEHPIEGVEASIPMVTKGGLEAITRSLAMEYAKDGIRFNAVAPRAPENSLSHGQNLGNRRHRASRGLSDRGASCDWRGAARRWRQA